MASIKLNDYQINAIDRMKNGCILCGGVGSGKSRTALAYYYKLYGGKLGSKKYVKMRHPADLYIITTARKRDTLEWESEMAMFLISNNPECTPYRNKVKVDSWNNIPKYSSVRSAFFIFDEQRVVGSGQWVKSFLKITERNSWILLSATPGDTWQDYIPVFIANGFYKNRTQFDNEHVVYKRFSKWPQVDRYIGTKKLERERDSILVTMNSSRKTTRHHVDIPVHYDIVKYKDIIRTRWNAEEGRPYNSASEICAALRKITNSDDSRAIAVLEILEDHDKAIIFYNFNYELEILRNLGYSPGTVVSEWNGQKHEPIPKTNKWVYLVQYTAGAEGWNCIETDTIIFYSQTYSYKVLEQACGRIDRLNTPYTDLYYYHLKSKSGIELSISRSLKNKKTFNESSFITNKTKGDTRYTLPPIY